MPFKRKIIPYNPNLKSLASQLRKNMTISEVLLWNELKQKKMLGYDFDRQKPIDNFIVDFYCKKLNLAIEIDGDTHIYRYDYDDERQKVLEGLGVHFLRFDDIEVKKSMTNVLRVIEDWIRRNQAQPRPIQNIKPTGPSKLLNPPPAPPRRGEWRGTLTGGEPGEKKPTPGPSQEGSMEPRPLPGGENGEEPSQEGSLGNATHGCTPERASIIQIGSLSLGGDLPVRLQSMTNTDTLDTKASVAQCIRIIEAGADMVRLTAQGTKEAENLANIKKELRKAGFDTPLIADIHFNPAAAERAAKLVEKVRINPGNYADKRASFIRVDFTEKEYSEELERIHSRLLPLIKICHEHGTAVRIGVNHGSLSDRIMTRYGNTPRGMAVSAMEFIRIFRSENFHRLVLSMKSSDTAVMVDSTRTLVSLMKEEGYYYPVHLGVTEAGEGEDGRIRSGVGIGALLAEGIGDTIRVSLSEDPEIEIPVAKEIVHSVTGGRGRIEVPAGYLPFKTWNTIYHPGVITDVNGKFFTESGELYKGRLITFKGGTFPDIPGRQDEKVMLHGVFHEDDAKKLAINVATNFGRYFIMRQAEGLCITNTGQVKGEKLKELSFSILQASEARITRTRYISCPTCGRTRFNLQEAVRQVKAATAHLTGLRIAVMGCIVNGPGEMAGSDYGYVGTAEGKVNIYRGVEPVLKNIPQEEAVAELVRLIEIDIEKY